MVEEIEEKKEFLKREEIRTMAKDLAKLREIEAQKEREKIAALKLEEKREETRVPAERVSEIPVYPPSAAPPEETPPKTSKLGPRPFLKKLNYLLEMGRQKNFQKILVRAAFCFLFVLIIGLLGWFLATRKPTTEEIVSPPEETIPPAEEIPPEEKIPEIIVPPSLIPVNETKFIEISENEEIPGKASEVFAENLTNGALIRIVIKNTTENRLSSLEELSRVSQIEAPEEILQKLEPDFTLAVFPQKQGKRIVLIAKTKGDLTNLFKNWEREIEKEGVFFSGQKIAALTPYFRSASYQNIAFRYLTISREDSGICYALFKDYFIFSTSFESLKKAIEELKKEIELSAWKIKVGQLFVVGFEGKEISPELEEFIKKYKPGGVLLLSKNIESREQLKNLISGLREISLRESGFPLFVAVDQEGGIFSRIGFLDSPGSLTPQSEIESPGTAYQIGQSRGEELKELGVNLNLAPVLDAVGSTDFLFGHSFQKSTSESGELAKSLISGQKAAGVLTAVKHFPGYSGISFNPEEQLGVRADVPETSQFKKAMEAAPELIMTSNVVYQSIDTLLPFTLSAKAIQYLKNNLGEKILIISDDLDQNSLLNKFSLKEIVVKPIEAGADILIFSGYRLPAENGLDAFWQAFQNGEVSREKIEAAYSEIIQLKQKLLE